MEACISKKRAGRQRCWYWWKAEREREGREDDGGCGGGESADFFSRLPFRLLPVCVPFVACACVCTVCMTRAVRRERERERRKRQTRAGTCSSRSLTHSLTSLVRCCPPLPFLMLMLRPPHVSFCVHLRSILYHFPLSLSLSVS